MKKEFKFARLDEVKGAVLDEAAGTLSGYAAVFSEIDEGGDIILPGAFKDTIEEFLSGGFTAHSHDWNVQSGQIGYPTAAKEDDYGFFVESAFHSTEDAQKVRTKASERMKAGKQVGLSIGFQLAAPAQYVYPKDYEKELPKYLRAETLEANLEKAKKFPRIRLLAKLDNYEYSIVTAPMMRLAQAASVKSATPPEISVKGMFEERLEERTNSLHNLYETLCYVLYQIQYMASSAERAGAELDSAALLDEALAEFTARVRAAVLSKLQSGDSMDAYYYYGRSGAQTKIDKFLSVKSALVTDVRLDEHSETVVSAVKEFAQIGAELTDGLAALVKRGKDKQEFRASTKEGRTISQATATRMSECVTQIESATTAMSAVKDDLSALVEMANPKEKADPALTRSLRTHSLRLQSRTLGVAV